MKKKTFKKNIGTYVINIVLFTFLDFQPNLHGKKKTFEKNIGTKMINIVLFTFIYSHPNLHEKKTFAKKY